MTEVKEKWALGLEPGWGGVHSGQKEQTIRVIVSTFRYKAKLEVWMEMAESKTTGEHQLHSRTRTLSAAWERAGGVKIRRPVSV